MKKLYREPLTHFCIITCVSQFRRNAQLLLQKTRTGNNETQNLKTYMDTDGIPNNFFDYISKNGQSTADMLDKVKTYCIHFYLCYFIFFTFTTDSTFCVLNHC